MKKPDWSLIKKNLKESLESAKEAGKELLKACESEKPEVVNPVEGLTPEERLAKVREMIAENPELTAEEIDNLLNGVFEPSAEDEVSKLEESVKTAFEELKSVGQDILDSDLIQSLKAKIDALVHDKDVEQLREVLNMESSLNDICAASKEFTKKVGTRVKNQLSELLDLGEKKAEEVDPKEPKAEE